MSKNDVPFHKVVASYVNNMVLPKEIGINGLSYSYGGSNINFDTNNTYPIVSVCFLLCRKEEFIVCLNFYLCSVSSVFSKLFCLRKRSYLFHSQRPYLDMQFKHFCLLLFLLDGSMC